MTARSTPHAARSAQHGEFYLCHDTYRRGRSVSVQWGAGMYSDNHAAFRTGAEVRDTSAKAEVAIISSQDEIGEVHEVHAYCSPAKVLALMTEVASR